MMGEVAADASSVAPGGTGGSPARMGPLSQFPAASPGLVVHFSRHWPSPSPHQPGQRPEYRNAQYFPVRRASLHPPGVADERSPPKLHLAASSQPPDLTGLATRLHLMVGGWQQWEVLNTPR